MKIKAIETHYNGYLFRSRLEARWAVFFDALGIKYEYEIEGFDLGDAGWYLPDFWIPHMKMWVEVKPIELNNIEKEKLNSLVIQSGHSGLMLIGVPDNKPYTAITNYWDYVGGTSIEIKGYGYGLDGIESPIGHLEYYLTNDGVNDGIFYNQDIEGADYSKFDDTIKAVNAARSARFEHASR